MSDIRARCNLDDPQFAARRKQLREELLPLVRGREELSDGLALRFDATPALREQLAAFVEFERACCPGLGFSLADAAGALRLEIRGIDPNAPVFAAAGEVARPETPADRPTRSQGLRLLRSAGVGGAAAFVLFCLVPIGIAAVVGAQLAAPLAVLDNPWAVGIGGGVFAGLLWHWERRRAAARKAAAVAGGHGC
jgi:hypothetical protein